MKAICKSPTPSFPATLPSIHHIFSVCHVSYKRRKIICRNQDIFVVGLCRDSKRLTPNTGNPSLTPTLRPHCEYVGLTPFELWRYPDAYVD